MKLMSLNEKYFVYVEAFDLQVISRNIKFFGKVLKYFLMPFYNLNFIILI